MEFRQISSILPEQFQQITSSFFLPTNPFLRCNILREPTDGVPANKLLFAETVPANKSLCKIQSVAQELIYSLRWMHGPMTTFILSIYGTTFVIQVHLEVSINSNEFHIFSNFGRHFDAQILENMQTSLKIKD